MPVQTSAPVTASFPSFMSVFGGDQRVEDKDRDHNLHGATIRPSNPSLRAQSSSTLPLHPAFQHRGSITSSGTESNESSPTTTVSTFDSVSVSASTDPSPSSSPESPSCSIPKSPFKSMMLRPVTAACEQASRNGFPPYQAVPSSGPNPESPGSKLRNVKNLSLSVVPTVTCDAPEGAAPDSTHPLSAPASPIAPPLRTGRRKPTNLTIQTPGFNKLTFGSETQAVIPPTPSGRPSLQHFASSPALPSLISPTSLPQGGMHLPKTSFSRLSSQPASERSSFSNQSSFGNTIEETREVDDTQVLKSQETTERGYTSGPVKIYDTGLYLYLEPSEEEATKFDVIINVAKEVKNPFDIEGAKVKPSVVSLWRKDGVSAKRSSMSEPQTALSEKSFRSAFEWPTTTTNPSAIPAMKTSNPSGPEYIHVPWDHNSEILEDLEPLCELIDSRINAGKSVLIHCQLGVSRSASLVIAYGLYKQYHSDFHSMYTAVKERSRWVGPNMSLIYQLMDFRAKMSKQDPRGAFIDNTATVGFKPAEADKPAESEKTPKAVNMTPLTTPPPVPSTSRMVSSATQTDFEPFYSIPTASTTSTPSKAPLSNPSSPPSNSSSPRPMKRATPRPLPFREKLFPRSSSEDTTTQEQIGSKPHGLQPLEPFSRPMPIDLAMQDVPQTPSILSPRAAEFMASPFFVSRSIAGDLAFTARSNTAAAPSGFPKPLVYRNESLVNDPRSPPQPGQPNEIVRSIDDLL